MHTRDFFYNNYKNHPEQVLARIAGEYSKLTPEAQEALRDILKEKGMDEVLAGIKIPEVVPGKLGHLTREEVRRLINTRLASGESIDLIKSDLRDKGVDIYKFSSSESEVDEKIEKRTSELLHQGKSKVETEQVLLKEYNITPESRQSQQERLKTNGAGLIIIGGVLLLITLPLAAVILQSSKHYSPQYYWGVPISVFVLMLGIKKRMTWKRMNRQD